MSNPRPLYEQHVAGPALAAFLRVAAAWSLDEAQMRGLLGYPSDSWWTACRERSSGALSLDQVERISYVLRVFRYLQEREDGAAADWLRQQRPEPIFGGRRPLDVMCLRDTRGLHQVARFLEERAEAGGDAGAAGLRPASAATSAVAAGGRADSR